MKIRIYKQGTLWFIGRTGGGISDPGEIPCLSFEQAIRGTNALITGRWSFLK